MPWHSGGQPKQIEKKKKTNKEDNFVKKYKCAPAEFVSQGFVVIVSFKNKVVVSFGNLKQCARTWGCNVT